MLSRIKLYIIYYYGLQTALIIENPTGKTEFC